MEGGGENGKAYPQWATVFLVGWLVSLVSFRFDYWYVCWYGDGWEIGKGALSPTWGFDAYIKYRNLEKERYKNKDIEKRGIRSPSARK